MAESTPTRSKSRRRGQSKSSGDSGSKSNGGAPDQEVEETRDEALDTDEPTGEAGDAAESGTKTVTSELKDTVREAAIEILKPVAKKATTEAAKFAVTKGPEMFKGSVMPKIADAGGAKGIAELAKNAGGGLLGKVTPGGDDDDEGENPEGTGKGRRLPVQEHVDVGVPIETAYNQWTQFEEFPKFMHRVEKVEQRDETHLMWHENIWGVRRQWEAEITQQRPNERITWKSLSGTNQVGVVTFHAISDTLTRVQVNLDFQPHGLKEKTASGFRMSRRALKSDLMRFKAFIEMRDDETGEWRGEIEDGDVVDEQDGGRDEERDDREERDDEPRGERESEEPESRSDDEEYEDEDEDEEEERPRSRRGRRFKKEEDESEDEPRAESDEDEAEEESEEEEEPAEEKPRRKSSRRAKQRA